MNLRNLLGGIIAGVALLGSDAMPVFAQEYEPSAKVRQSQSYFATDCFEK